MTPQLKSAIYTAVLCVLVVLLMCSAAFAYHLPDPPIPEEGVEVNLGDSDTGLGNEPEPASSTSSYAPPAANAQVATQHTEPTPSVPSSPSPTGVTNPNAPAQPEPESKEPEINKNALFNPNRTRNNGGGAQGNTSGSGNQGAPNGSTEGQGLSGNGGGSNRFSLAGRSAVRIPEPSYKSNKQGTVVVRIWVDRQGKVTRAEYEPKGSNTVDSYLVEQALKAARQAHFSASADAQEEQKGTITYIFKI